MDQPCQFSLQLILIEYLLNLNIPILPILLNLLLNDDLNLIQHVLLAEGLQLHFILLRVGFEQVVDLTERWHDWKFVIYENGEYEIRSWEFLGDALELREYKLFEELCAVVEFVVIWEIDGLTEASILLALLPMDGNQTKREDLPITLMAIQHRYHLQHVNLGIILSINRIQPIQNKMQLLMLFVLR